MKAPAVKVRRSSKTEAAEPAKKASRSDISKIVAAVGASIGSSSTMTLEDQAKSKSKDGPVMGWVKTGLWGLDWIIGDWRGVPLGRITAIWGGEGSGKSSIAQAMIRPFQRKRHGVALYCDADGALDHQQLERTGADLSRVIVPQTSTLEEMYDAMKAGIQSLYGEQKLRKNRKSKSKIEMVDGEPVEKKKDKVSTDVTTVETPMLVVADSITAAAPRDLLEEDNAEEVHVGKEARIISAQNKKLRQWIRNRPVHVILIAEERDNIGAVGAFAPKSKMAGARSIRFACSTILRVSHGGYIRRGDEVTGHKVYVSVDRKARLAKPGRSIQLVLSYSKEQGEGGPHRAKSNYLFLDEVAGMIVKKGKAGVTIRGLEDTVGVFQRNQWAGIMETHEKLILAAVKERMAHKEAKRKENEGSADGE